MTWPGGSTGADAQLFALLSLAYVAVFGGHRLYRQRNGDIAPDELDGAYLDWARSAVVLGLAFASATLVLAFVTDLPLVALGVGDWTVTDLRVGVGLGLALLGVTLLLQVGLDRLDLPDDRTWTAVRDLSTPTSAPEWALHAIGVQPVLAVGLELLFRGAVMGGPAAAWGLPAGVLVGLSAGAQGLYSCWLGPRALIVTVPMATGLAVGFVATGSLLVPIVAHLVVNLAETVQRLVTAGPCRGSAAL